MTHIQLDLSALMGFKILDKTTTDSPLAAHHTLLGAKVGVAKPGEGDEGPGGEDEGSGEV